MLSRSGVRALPLIYDAGLNADQWTPALDAIVAACGANVFNLAVSDSNSDAPYKLDKACTGYVDWMARGEGPFYMENLRHHEASQIEALLNAPALTPIRDEEVGIAAAILEKRPDYEYLRKTVGIRRRVGMRLTDNKVWTDIVALGFPEQITRVSERAMRECASFGPHLAKAVTLGRAFAELKSRFAAVLGALDRVLVGMAVAKANGDIIVGNAEMGQLLDGADGLRLKQDGKLAAADDDTTEAILDAIAVAASTAAGEAANAERLVVARRPSGRKPYLVEISPLKDSVGELETNLEAALVHVIDPEKVPPLRMNRFAEAYGLTAAETDVCRHIFEGLEIADIAERRDTAAATTKTQVASILSKTGVQRRAALVRLFVRVLPPID